MYKTAKFKVFELYALNTEIAAILKEKMPVVLKFDLTELNNRIINYLKPVDGIRTELSVKYPFSSPEDENYKQFEKEFSEVLDQERELKYIPIARQKLEFESHNNYGMLYRLVETPLVKES